MHELIPCESRNKLLLRNIPLENFKDVTPSCTSLVSMGQQSLRDQCLLIIEVSRSHSDNPHSVGLLWTSHRPLQRLYLTTHNTHKRQTFFPPTESERTIPAS